VEHELAYERLERQAIIDDARAEAQTEEAEATSPEPKPRYHARPYRTVNPPLEANVNFTRQFRTNLRDLTAGRIFGATFLKKDGSIRRMSARLGVGASRLAENDPEILTVAGNARARERFALLTVYDMRAQGYRSVNLHTLITLQVCGNVIIHNPLPETLTEAL
jgi:hypothetical protein